MSEQVHSRIDELMSLHTFMKDAEIESGSKTAETIMEMWVEGNMPYIKQIDDEFFRAFFKPSRNFPESPDTLAIRKASLSDLAAELPHQKQWSQPQAIRDSLLTSRKTQKKKYGERPGMYGYEKKVPVEGREGYFTKEKYFPSMLMELDPQLGWTESAQDTLSPTSRIHYEKYDPSKKQDLPIEFEAHQILEELWWDRIAQSIAEDMENNGKP